MPAKTKSPRARRPVWSAEDIRPSAGATPPAVPPAPPGQRGRPPKARGKEAGGRPSVDFLTLPYGLKDD